MYFDRKKFFTEYRKPFGSLSPQQVKGLERLLTGIENDPYIAGHPLVIPFGSYMLATVKRETAHTFTPIHEYGGKAYFIKRYGGQTRKGKELGNDTPEEGYFYAGKSDVQVTGESNYEKVEEAMRREYPEIVRDFERRTGKTFDLTVGDQPGDTLDPMNILDPAISYAVMSYGMRTGLFTGLSFTSTKFKKLTGLARYKAWRGIINGTDHDDEIAADAVKFEKILTLSAVAAPVPESVSPAVNPNGNPAASSQTPDDQATPDVNSTPPPSSSETNIEQNADTIINEESLVDKTSKLGDKFQSFQGVLDKFGFSIEDAKRSIGTVLLTWAKVIWSIILTALGLFLNHWELFIIAALLLILAYLMWDRSGLRVAKAKEGMPVEVAKEILK